MKRLAYACSVLAILVVSAASAFGQAKAVPAKPIPQPANVAKPEPVKVGFKTYLLGSSVKPLVDEKKITVYKAFPHFDLVEYHLNNRDTETFAGYPLGLATLTSYKDEVVEIGLIVNGNLDTVVEAITSKYGSPTNDSPFKNQMFVEYDWSIGKENIRVMYNPTKPKNVHVTYTSEMGQKQLSKLHDYNRQQKAREERERLNDQ